ncbi:putative quinol monooxygenase [Vibrio quintilis]|uniref:Antibiotic biosynthesis monooxygenase n=1 Tax=Vibrio quintilis TaxID=1117707 RepID=A0A1M7YQV4_9VIBR|nr:putative quinol monooxygenase [Vibrio quintilis]SHO54989.1 Antibiotic biosynthesis monooxygenase [Vibrio quintilis]
MSSEVILYPNNLNPASSGCLGIKGYILVPPADLEVVRKELVHHQRLTHQEPGCLVFEVTESESEPGRFDVYEVFVDQAAFDAHQARMKSSRWGAVSVHIERHYQILSENF